MAIAEDVTNPTVVLDGASAPKPTQLSRVDRSRSPRDLTGRNYKAGELAKHAKLAKEDVSALHDRVGELERFGLGLHEQGVDHTDVLVQLNEWQVESAYPWLQQNDARLDDLEAENAQLKTELSKLAEQVETMRSLFEGHPAFAGQDSFAEKTPAAKRGRGSSAA